MAKKRNSPSYRYATIEALLAKILEVKPKAMGAFKARVRHLRKLGVPQLPTPGTGQKVDYKREHAIELLIALRAQELGHTPAHAVDIVTVARHFVSDLDGLPSRGQEQFLVIQPGSDSSGRSSYFAR